ncbi:MAG: PAS domain-containing sensor histidine kinase [Halobacteriaceae archaeon]
MSGRGGGASEGVPDSAALLDRMTDAFFALDREWRFTYLNERARDVLCEAAGQEATVEELVGSVIWELLPDAEETEAYDRFREAMADGEPVTYENYYPPLDATLEVRAYPDEDGLSVFFRDVTERVAREREAALFRRLVDSSPDAMMVADAETGEFVEVNETACERLGYDRDQLLGMTVPEVEDRFADIGAYREHVERVREEGPLVIEGEHHRADGTTVPVEVNVAEVSLDREYLVSISRDVTERERIERELRRNQAALQELYEVSAETELGFEEKVERLLAVGCDHLDLPIGFLTRIEDGVQEVVVARGDHPDIQPGESCPLEETYCRRTVAADGLVGVLDAPAEWGTDDPGVERFDLGSYVGAKVVVDGDLYGTVCFADDEPRDRGNERLEEFASVVSHDLRNPLNVADGNLELAREQCDAEELEAVEDALDRMAAIIDDVLTLAREGETVAEVAEVSLAAVARDAWESVETDGATLTVEDNRSVRADADRLQRALENLFRNAVEHAGPAVEVTVGATPRGFYVADDGPGIPAEEREDVFDHGYSTAADGTGFGLAIVREIAAAHGWTVSVGESESGGARFEFRT